MIPQELQTLPQWVVAGSNKVPLNPRSLKAASVTDSRTWGTFIEAQNKALEHNLYLGFVFTSADPFIGIDLDAPENDEQRTRHDTIYNAFQTYSELSVSGNGVHIICKGTIPHAAKRDHVEIYDRERYFIVTGNTLNGHPTSIEDYNDLANQIVIEMSRHRSAVLSYSEPETLEDTTVLTQCANSANGEKFKQLWLGQWKQKYSSQSEADYALINMIAFASRNNEQCKRLFRESALGQRSKALREAYLDTMIGNIRAEQYPAVDFSQFKPPTIIQLKPEPLHLVAEFKFPDGLVGELAQYIYDTAIKPIPQVALVASLGLLAGLTGRTYNISNTGLNLYFLCIAGTATGKEGAAQGIHRIVKAVSPKLPSIEQYIGPKKFASGQGLIRQLESTPCMVSVMGEFGHVLKRICDPHATSADTMWRELFLELFNQSGPNDELGKMVYSDTGKNTVSIKSPAFSIVAESTAAIVFESLSEQAIEMGLIPRFILVECSDERPPTNDNAWVPPSDALVCKVEALAHRCLSMGANNTRQKVAQSVEARRLFKAFDKEVDTHINAQKDDAIRQIWSRALMKALRLAALLAVGVDFDKPSVNEQQALWSIEFVRTDARSMINRFLGGVGGGDSEQLARLRTAIVSTLQAPRSGSRRMREYGVVSHRQLSQRCYVLGCFRNDRRGAGDALTRAIKALKDNGELVELNEKDVKGHFGITAKCYRVTDEFSYKLGEKSDF